MILSEATTSCEAAVQKARGAVLSPASYESGKAERNSLREFKRHYVPFKVQCDKVAFKSCKAAVQKALRAVQSSRAACKGTESKG